MLIWSLACICCIQHALVMETSSKEVKVNHGFQEENTYSSAKSYSFLVDVVNTAGKIGGTLNLFAQVLKNSSDPTSAYVGWEYNPGHIVSIWNENDPDSIDDEKFGHVLTDHGDNTFDYNLTIFADATMSGPYKAHFLLNGNVKTQGYVVILDVLRCPPAGDTKDEGELVTLSCDTYFYGYKSPVLKWFVEDIEILSNLIVVDNKVISIINTTSAVDQDEVTYSCRLMFEQGEGEPAPPTYQDQCTTFYYVNHPVNNVIVDPNPEDAPGEVLQMSLGDYINCSAGGRPEPWYTWSCDDGQIIQGASLLMTESFVRDGGASVMCTCEAENVVNGFPYMVERDVHFVIAIAESFFVGFTAWQSASQSYSPGDTIIYEEVTLNQGGHYTPSTGHFLCPVNGIYLTFITGRAFDVNSMYVQIVKDSEFCGSILEHSARLPWNTVSNGCLMECSAGQVIHVQAKSLSGYVYGDPNVPYSLFSVLLITELGEDRLHESFDGSTAWKPEVQSYSTGDVITFPNVHYNQPGSYEPAVSRYVCREDGIYLVLLTVMKNENSVLNIGIEHNSNLVMSLHDLESGNEFNQISNSVLLRCEMDQIITVKATGGGSVFGIDDSDYYSSFTVIMMDQDDSEKHVSFVGCSVSKSLSQNYISEETITYDQIAVNVGDLFNPNTSQFICQNEAVYYVTATARKLGTSDLQINIMHESTTLFRLEDLESGNPDNIVSNSAAVRCGAQEVIQVKAAGSGSIYGSTGPIFTIFNVMKIS